MEYLVTNLNHIVSVARVDNSFQIKVPFSKREKIELLDGAEFQDPVYQHPEDFIRRFREAIGFAESLGFFLISDDALSYIMAFISFNVMKKS